MRLRLRSLSERRPVVELVLDKSAPHKKDCVLCGYGEDRSSIMPEVRLVDHPSSLGPLTPPTNQDPEKMAQYGLY